MSPVDILVNATGRQSNDMTNTLTPNIDYSGSDEDLVEESVTKIIASIVDQKSEIPN